ncbi:type IV secretory system conjugative DNA transfer family protein [Pseudonocardia sp. WMMC193]|uniref:type IV secretory system conjugative DNA transfer family protein n=1 Tax=Pseudonocardia sp. WMMC193 TaxID=2911965 RepID=UPI001F348045|nr:type IV secretory system conjugative DNA transfer family protein [Pseudonocardia sp. WMMC193]MCF7550906.1 type IV secretory system conjugative DNA transfer family protein [Pseudonocardia sp. WMMC193]
MTLLLLVVFAAGAALAWRTGARWIAGFLALVAALAAWRLIGHLGWWALAGGGLLASAVGWHLWSRTSSRVVRWSARSRRKSGVASTVDIARFASAAAMRRKASSVRPELAALPRAARGAIRARDVAVALCRVGAQWVWASVEDVIVLFGGPRTGKTGWLAGRVIDAPGAALVTSTRTDLLELTAPLRSRRGPVYVFNAVGLGGHASTITFDPLTGCKDPVTAAERAGDLLVSGSHGGGDREFWETQARRVLAAFMHAAALGNLTMREVLRWVTAPDEAEREVASLLRTSPAPEYAQDATQFVTTNDRTRTSITSTIMPALGWLTSPAASAAASGESPFVVEELLASNATVYLLGAEETQAAPLVCALTGYVAREARRLAATRPSGRLDPPLTLALDEAALISPVPLQSWTADMGGRGVTIIAAFQSRAQVIARWGDTGAAIILNNAAVAMVFGGTRDRDDLAFWSTLAGERDEPITTTDLNGRTFSRTVRKVPVLAPAQIANLPTGYAVVYRRGIPPVVGKVLMAWRRRDVRAHARSLRGDQRRRRFRVRRDVVIETALDTLAARWPGRFADPASRFHEARNRDETAPAVVEAPPNVIPLPGRRS